MKGNVVKNHRLFDKNGQTLFSKILPSINRTRSRTVTICVHLIDADLFTKLNIGRVPLTPKISI